MKQTMEITNKYHKKSFKAEIDNSPSEITTMQISNYMRVTFIEGRLSLYMINTIESIIYSIRHQLNCMICM